MAKLSGILASCKSGEVLKLPEGQVILDEPIVLGPEHSGCTFQGHHTMLDGGKPVREWRREGLLWVAPLPPGHQCLYRNGQPVPTPRYPAQGLLHCEHWENERKPGTFEWLKSFLHVTLPEQVREDAKEAELVLYFGWQCCRLKGFDLEESGIRLPSDENMCAAASCSFAFEDMPLAYMLPGQWLPDRKRGLICYQPLESEQPDQENFCTAGMPTLLVLDGAEHVTFEDVTFCHTGDHAIRNARQADWRGTAAVQLQGAKHCTFRRCRFEELSCWGADLLEASTDNRFEDCTFETLGGGGVKMSGGTVKQPPELFCGRNAVVNCRFAHGGLRWAGTVAVLIRQSGDNLIADNEIAFFPYSGISCGWTWGYLPNKAEGNQILRNEIHDLGSDQLVLDMGGIYTVGVQHGTKIMGNHIYRIQGRFFCWGIYLDEGSSEVEVSGNLVHDCVNEPFRVHFGRHNLVHDNVFVGSTESACCSTTRGTMGICDLTFTPGDKVFHLNHNLCIANGMPFFMKYLLDTPGKQEMLDTWAGDDNLCWQLQEDCQAKFCDDYHFQKKTYTVIPDEVFIAPGRDEHSRFFSGPMPTVEHLRELAVDEGLCTLFKRYLDARQN